MLLRDRICVTLHGERLKIANVLDIDGEETDDPELATSIVFPLPGGNWMAMMLVSGDIDNVIQLSRQ